MAEPITEMYCENCGQRHGFERAKPGGVARIRRVSRGLRSYVLNEAPTLGDAMADAWTRLEAEGTVREVAALGATFTLCLECRRYVCHDCWNTAESLCRTCAPTPEDVLAASTPATPVAFAVPMAEPAAVVPAAPEAPTAVVEPAFTEPAVVERPAEIAPAEPQAAAVAEVAPAVAVVEPTVVEPTARVEPIVVTDAAPLLETAVIGQPEPVAPPARPIPDTAEPVAITAEGTAAHDVIDVDVIAAALAAGLSVDGTAARAPLRAAPPIEPVPRAGPVEVAAPPARQTPGTEPVGAPPATASQDLPPATPPVGSVGAVTPAAPGPGPTEAAPRPTGRHRRRPAPVERANPSPIRCGACGLHLPAAARYCRRCGVRQGVEA